MRNKVVHAFRPPHPGGEGRGEWQPHGRGTATHQAGMNTFPLQLFFCCLLGSKIVVHILQQLAVLASRIRPTSDVVGCAAWRPVSTVTGTYRYKQWIGAQCGVHGKQAPSLIGGGTREASGRASEDTVGRVGGRWSVPAGRGACRFSKPQNP